MPEVVVLILLALAVARLCVLMVDDYITDFFRDAIYKKYGGDHLLFEGATCHWCWSVWFAFPMTFLTFPSHGVWTNILTALAVSFAASKLSDW